MFLRSLSLRGFKSFADRTVLDVEPGITVIVGPNGSGKSNVVDALAWVLGTHSARKVRGGSMADVVFAGSPNRNRANQARVEITIDNSDGVLSGGVGTAASAGEFGEVRVARVIHHDGEALYEINGEEVRALDVQELLSDTGLGRELHTVIGQGQLDEILNARPEERRRYIEEAAGILKHRRRRERALRKLEQVDEHVEKLRTVLRELRRQLRPLERQAEAADRHAALQSELRDVRVRAAAVELDRLTRALEAESRGTSDVAQRLEAAEQHVVGAREHRTELEEQLSRVGTDLEVAGDRVHAFASLTERVRGTADLVEARRRHLIEYVEEPLAGRPPAQLREDAARVDTQRITLTEELERRRAAFEEHLAQRRAAEGARREHEQVVQAERRRRAEQRERVLRWEGEVSALRGAIASAESELGRVTSTVLGLDTRIAETRREAETVENDIQELDVLEVDLTAALEDAEATVEDLDTRHRELTDQVRDLDARRSSQAARGEALRAALAESDAGVAALLDGFDRVRGRVADHVRVDPDAASAVAAVLGTLADAVVVPTGDAARDAVAWLRDAQAGRAVVVSTEPEGELAAPERVSDPSATPLADHVHALDGARDAGPVVAAVRRWLVGGYLVKDWKTAVQLHRQYPASTFVTAKGDVAGPQGYRAGGPAERSVVTTAAAAETAEAEVARLDRELARATAQRDTLAEELAEARRVLDDATDRINGSDARITGAAERLARLHKELHALTNQREVVAGQQQELEQVLERDRASLSELHGRGPDDVDVPDDEPGDDAVARELDAAVEAARERELDARVGLERVTEQVRHLEVQADTMRREAEEVEAALADAARRREARRRGIDRCGQIALIVRSTLEVLERSSTEASAQRQRLTEDLSDVRT
ncbi:MAG: AAA family ATPase, partial [Nitriliruptoraceae bacterium]